MAEVPMIVIKLHNDSNTCHCGSAAEWGLVTKLTDRPAYLDMLRDKQVYCHRHCPQPIPMTISLDFDRTFTKDPELWKAFCGMARQRGHKVICVTMRNEKPHQADEIKAALTGHVDDIVFTAYKAKMPHMQGRDTTIDVWIDDDPRTIHQDMEPWP